MISVYSKKALLLIPDGSARSQLQSALASSGYSAEQPTVKVGTFESLRREAPLAKGLSFFQQSFISYVQRDGVPYCIVINLNTDLSLPKETDPDRLLLLREIMLSFITLNMMPQYSDLRAHLMIVVGRADQARADECERNPSFLLKGMTSQNEQINARIELLRNDNAAFSRLFLIRYQKAEDLVKNAELMVKGFIAQIATRYTLEKKLKAYNAPAISVKDIAPVSVVYKINEKDIFIDGVKAEIKEEHTSLKVAQFHVIGSLTTQNIKKAIEMIRVSVVEGIGEKKYALDDEIVITLLDDCRIDATAATGLAQLFITGLPRYKKKKLIVNTVNDGMLRKSQGYGMIREFIRVDSY